MKTQNDKPSAGNVFADLGLPDSEERLAKAELARQIGSIIDHRHLTQVEAAGVLGTAQPKVSDLLNGRLAGFSMERLIRFLVALDRDVQIVVRQKPRSHARARVSVAQVPPHLVRKDEARVSGVAGSGR
jgi:predicted XRE-type DNA-binding protein